MAACLQERVAAFINDTFKHFDTQQMAPPDMPHAHRNAPVDARSPLAAGSGGAGTSRAGAAVAAGSGGRAGGRGSGAGAAAVDGRELDLDDAGMDGMGNATGSAGPRGRGAAGPSPAVQPEGPKEVQRPTGQQQQPAGSMGPKKPAAQKLHPFFSEGGNASVKKEPGMSQQQGTRAARGKAVPAQAVDDDDVIVIDSD